MSGIVLILLVLIVPMSVSAQSPTSQPVPTTQPMATTQPSIEVTSAVVKSVEPTPTLRLAIDPNLLPDNPLVPAASGKKRFVVRPKPMTTLEYLAWGPRVVFYPVHLVLEYGVRWPLEQVTEYVERESVIDRVIGFTEFDDGNGLILPRFAIRSEFTPAFGIGVAWDNAFFEGGDFAVGADIGPGSLTIDASTRLRVWDDGLQFTFGYEFAQRSDFIFYGFGSRSLESNESRFSRQKNGGHLKIAVPRRSSGFGATTTFEVADYQFGCSESDDDICGVDQQIGGGDDRFALEEDALIAFVPGYAIGRVKANVFWDSRNDRPSSGSGLRLDAFGEVGQSIDGPHEYTRFGGEAAGFWDVYNQRVLGVRLRTEFAEPIGDATIPFGELVTLGGLETMRGFGFGRFNGQSAVVATVDYRYPIWSFLDANVFFEFGNAFGSQLDDFEFGALRPSVGLSLKTVESRYNTFDITLGLGGERFDAAEFGIADYNIGFGTNWGY